MSSNLLPLVLLGGAAVLVMKKKKKKASTTLDIVQVEGLPDMLAPPTKKKAAGSQTWRKRQQALVDTGYDVGKSGVDGVPGRDTRNAIMEFQKDAGITVDGKWGPQTAAAMVQALKMAFEGLGRAAYNQIGSMLSKFASSLKSFGQGKESDDIGLAGSEDDVVRDQLYALSVANNNPNLDPDKVSLQMALMQFQMIFGLDPTGTATLETRVKLNEVLSGA